jgi:chromosome segregation ATPase
VLVQDKEKLLAAKAAAKKRAEAAKALLAPVAAPTVDESGHPVKPPEPCRRTGCKDLERRLKQREETILDERGELAEMCQQLSQKLMVLEEQVAESERTNQTLEARSRAMKKHIAQTKEHTENLRTEAGVIKHQNVTIQNQIMHLELELQRGHAEARQAQADMVKAML